MRPTVVCLLAAVFSVSSASDFQRTVIAIRKVTAPGEYVFLRGGGPEGVALPIRHNIVVDNKKSFYAQTSKGDNRLEWGGYQSGQGIYRNGNTIVFPDGTPMIWSTNDTESGQTVMTHGSGHWDLNTGGDHYWVVDVDMDCSVIAGGWFEFKGYIRNIYTGSSGWEGSNINQFSCDVDWERINIPGAVGWNHYGICGFFNIVDWERADCMAAPVDTVVAYLEH